MSLLVLLQDSVVVDTLQGVIDSVASETSGVILEQAKPLMTLILGVVVRFVYEGSRHILTFINSKSPAVKSIIALAWSQVAVFGTMFLPESMPDIPADIGTLPTFGVGLIVWGLSMGVNTLVDIIKKKW